MIWKVNSRTFQVIYLEALETMLQNNFQKRNNEVYEVALKEAGMPY